MKALYAGLVVCGWLLLSVMAQADIAVGGGFFKEDLSRHWQVLEDTGLRMDVGDLPAQETLSSGEAGTVTTDTRRGWTPVHGTIPNFGFTDSAFWFRTRITSGLLWPETLYLQIAYPLLSEIDVYWRPSNGKDRWFQAGYHMPFSAREMPNRNFIFPLDLPAKGSGELLLRVRSQSSLQMPAHLMNARTLMTKEERAITGLGIAMGIPAVMLCYNFLLYLTVRERNYLYYTLHALTVLAFLAVWQGLSARYFLPENIWWRRHEIALTGTLATLFCNLFAEHYLGLYYRRFALLSLYRGIRLLCVAMLALLWFLPEGVSNVIVLMLATASTTCVSVAVMASIRTGGRAVRIFCLAWATLIIGVFLIVFSKLGLLPLYGMSGVMSEDWLLATVNIELLLISFALGDRVNAERYLKLHAQETALNHAEREKEARRRAMAEEREAQRNLNDAVEMQRTMHQTLEMQVQERTQALETAHQRLLALYEEDPLTALKNRRYFSERLKDECKRAQQLKYPLALLLIDVDHFKRVNDTWGHLQGDRCIRHLADLLKAGFSRPSDCVARYGGEEFAILITQCDAKTAQWVSENLRQRVEAAPAIMEGQVVNLSISVGVVVFVPDEKHDVDRYLQLADDALYRAKSEGRNCVRHSVSGMAQE